MATRLRASTRARARAGFSLIEMMIAVAILGILAAIAIPSFRAVMKRSKTGEASLNLAVMFKSASAYYNTERAEQGNTGAQLLHCTVSTAGPLPVTPGQQKKPLPTTDPSFRAIGFSSADYVYYAYGLLVDGMTGRCNNNPSDPTIYTLYANGDLDEDSIYSLFELAVGSDDDNTLYHARGLYIDNETE